MKSLFYGLLSFGLIIFFAAFYVTIKTQDMTRYYDLSYFKNYEIINKNDEFFFGQGFTLLSPSKQTKPILVYSIMYNKYKEGDIIK